jgi:hypothetical protein
VPPAQLLAALRLALLATSLATAAVWARAACRQRQRGRLVAEAQWLCVMLAALVCWQNPVSAPLPAVDCAAPPAGTAVQSSL